ncbi:phosphatase PAP2 family protein [Streptomyces candidus]|uniref:Undecaprenyl-diphosphatase n=1 Tax=Streptomyces candidus TaxID=67283 RepID=A0A7X0HK49_9ACTN|nr:phosphatase PAP2 family protein [Streptomyces candidus]MBB6437839.1 undecaprenyl-diphosphatase [Streptomyces candidus]GHH50031.1 phosphatase PAP2 family protein [Streptomyces candidus]
MPSHGPLPPARSPVLLAGALLAALSAVLLTLVALDWGPLLALDGRIADGLHRVAVEAPGATRANRLLSDWVWDPWAMRAVVAGVFVWLLRHGERVLALWLAGTSLVAACVQQLLKFVVGRERPQWPDPVDSAHYAAFPSGHAMTAAVTFGLLLWLLRLYGAGRGTRAWLLTAGVVSVVGVGFTRVFLGVHWLTDVLAGWLMGAALVLFSVALHAYRTAPRA